MSKTRALLILFLLLVAIPLGSCGGGCGGFTGYGGGLGCGGGNSITLQTILSFSGPNNTPFTGTVSDAADSYTFSGTTPLQVIFVNNVLPIRAVAFKTKNDNSLLSLQVIQGYSTTVLSSTTAPYGAVSVSLPTGTGQVLQAFSPPPGCDVRFYVTGAIGDTYTSLVETKDLAFENLPVSPSLYLISLAVGNISGQFYRSTYNVPNSALDVELIINGNLMGSGVGDDLTVTSGCPS